MKTVCKQCGKEFEAARSTAKYCSESCKQHAKRDTLTVDTLSNDTLRDPVVDTLSVTERPVYSGGPDCSYQHCRQARGNSSRLSRIHGPWLPTSQLATMGSLVRNRVTLPGDSDYIGVCS